MDPWFQPRRSPKYNFPEYHPQHPFYQAPQRVTQDHLLFGMGGWMAESDYGFEGFHRPRIEYRQPRQQNMW